MEEKKSMGKELQEKLTFTQPHIADEQPDAVAEAERFCVDYKAFLDAAKTEREAAAEVERRALAAGYRPMQRTGVTYKAGDKVFYNNRGKAMLLATLGKRPLDEGVRLMVAHIDSPRLDLKPNPLYEDSDIDVVDIGVPVLSMHSPFELVSKLDVYMTYKAFSAFATA